MQCLCDGRVCGRGVCNGVQCQFGICDGRGVCSAFVMVGVCADVHVHLLDLAGPNMDFLLDHRG